jgi:signal transduction histidine kinase
MQQFAGISLKTRLYILVLVAFIPVAVLIYYIAEEQKTIETEAILHKTLMLANAAAGEESQQLEATRNLLASISEVFLMTSDPDEMRGFLAGLRKHTHGYEDFGILRPDGRLLAGSDGSSVLQDYRSEPWFSACLQNKALTIGRYHDDYIRAKPVLYFALPAIDSHHQIAGVAFAAFNLNWMTKTFSSRLADLPKGSRLVLLDGSQSMLSYDVDFRRWSIPPAFEASVRGKILESRSGTLSASDENGIARIYAFTPLTSSLRAGTVFVVLEIPRASALSASKRIFKRNVALLILSAFIAVASIWWASDIFILRRVRAMVAASRRLAAGDLEARIGEVGVRDEISHLAGVFDEMAAALQMRLEREAQVMASLKHSREQLRKLAAHQNEVREQERIRIARELHDQFGQCLTILKMDLSWLRRQTPVDMTPVHLKIGAMSGVIDEALKNLHAVTAELRPVILDDFGLTAAIEWQIEEFCNRSGIDCRLENGGYEPNLPREVATALFRIFQETITNIMRHAQADRVVVRLEEHDRELMLQVQDNGRGITEAEINDPKAFGLLGIRERLYPWNGRVAIEGRPGQGTCVTAYLPMPSKGVPQ